MKRLRNWILGLGMAALIVAPLVAQGPVQDYPISAFLDGQNWLVHLNTGLGILPVGSLCFDAFGTQAKRYHLNIDTSFGGSVRVRELSNGRVHVSVHLETRNALCWGDQKPEHVFYPAFGYTPVELQDPNLAPSLGDGILQAEFTMASLRIPLPMLQDLWGNGAYPAEFVHTLVRCEGMLRSGSGYPEGTPGRALMIQTMLNETGAHGHCAGHDCWPVEIIQFWPTAPH